MDCYSDHSAILDYLAQVEQEEQLRESLKRKSGIAALRVEKGKIGTATQPTLLVKITDLVDEITLVEFCSELSKLTCDQNPLDCAMEALLLPGICEKDVCFQNLPSPGRTKPIIESRPVRKN